MAPAGERLWLVAFDDGVPSFTNRRHHSPLPGWHWKRHNHIYGSPYPELWIAIIHIYGAGSDG